MKAQIHKIGLALPGAIRLRKQTKKGTKAALDQPKVRKAISVESATLLVAFLTVGSNGAFIERAVKLGLRGPELIREKLKIWLESLGQNVDFIMNGEPTTPATQAEVMELFEPILKRGTEMASYAQLGDIYLFGKKQTPENIVYAFYIGARLFIAGERKPTKEESKRIWETALEIASTSKIGAPHWKKLESRGAHGVKDWVDPIKEKARKKFETFLDRKKRIEATAQESFKSLISTFLDEEETS